MRDVLDRIMERVVIVAESGCFIYMGRTVTGGYGRVAEGGKEVLTHRVVFQRLKGEIPDGMQIDHVCRVTSCCNPDHLQVVTPVQNMARARWATTTHCPKGHEYTVGNVIVGRRGNGRTFRMCRECNRQRARAAYLAKRGA